MTESDSLDINFKSTLPPRKRAKTKEEKEQRRVERILRNRRAAHASREKKRRHVEFLESYVMKLESNLDRLQKNFDIVGSKVDPTVLKGLRLLKLDDLSSLKEQIHLNLGLVSLEPETKRRRTMTDDSPERESSVEKESSAESALATGDESGCDVQVKVEYDDSEDFSLSNTNSNDNVYFNYLSPISINSPVNSPIDLTLKKSDEEVTPLSLGGEESVREDEGLGQNSEEILLPRGYEEMSTVVEV